MGRPKKQPAPPDLEQLHQVDEIEGVVLVEYRDQDAAGMAGFYVDESDPDTPVGFQALDGTVYVVNESAAPADEAQDPTPETPAAAKKRKARGKRDSNAPKVKKGDTVRTLFMAPGPRTAECGATVVAVHKGGTLDLEMDPMNVGTTHVREGIPWGDGKTADTWH